VQQQRVAAGELAEATAMTVVVGQLEIGKRGSGREAAYPPHSIPASDSTT
jgi:hypothetical protein